MIFLGMQLASGKGYQLIRQIHIIVIIPVRLNCKLSGIRFCQKIGKILLHTGEQQRFSLLCKICTQLLYRLIPLLLRTDRLQRLQYTIPLTGHVKHAIFFTNLHMIRLAPHKEIRKVKMRVFIITAAVILI